VVVILEEFQNQPAARTNMKSNRIKNWPAKERPRERKQDGGLDWQEITKVKILGVEDTHD